MPRSRSGKSNGARRSSVLGRRSRNAKKTRIINALRRFGFITALVVTSAWGGAWLWMSGTVTRTMDNAELAFQDSAAEAGYAVQNVLVEGRVNADPDVLLGLINARRGDPIMAFDPAQVKTQLERISWVESAHVERRLPDTIYVRLIERAPLALWQHQGKIRLVDGKGTVLAETNLAKFRDLPLIVGEDAPFHAAPLIGLLGGEPTIRDQVEAITWVGERRWDLKMNNGVVVRLPEGDVALALSRLAKAEAEDGLLKKDITMVDLRESNRITVRTAPGRVQEYKASFSLSGDNDI